MRPILIIAMFAAAVTAADAKEPRQLGAHEHGHGKLNMVIEGGTVGMELEVPGADIVGFEHVAKSKQDKAAVAAAKKLLASPLSLIVPPAAAGCSVKSAKVEFSVGHHDEHKDGQAGKAANKPGADAHGDEEEAHAEFHASYTLTCASPDKLTTLSFKYFDAFPAAQELDITLIAPKGQSKYEATRKSPTITLTGLR